MENALEKREITDLDMLDQVEAAALAAIEEVTDPSEAMRIVDAAKFYEQAVRIGKLGDEYIKRWGAVRLRAERKAGELLPPPRPGNGSNQYRKVPPENSAPDDKKARFHARKVAAVPEDEFEEYLAADPQPTRRGLLRHHETPGAGTRRPGPAHRVSEGTSEAIIREAMRRLRAGRPADIRQLADQFGVGRYAAEQRVGLAKERLRVERGGDPRGPSVGHDGTTSAERERKRKAQAKAARKDDAAAAEYVRLTTILWRMSELAGALEHIDLGAEVPDVIDDLIWMRLDEMLDELVHLGVWVDRQTPVIRARLGDMKVRDKIAKLEAMAASTPHEPEAKAMRERAAKLRRENRLGNGSAA